MKNNYGKGARFERELIALLEEQGWIAGRFAGSGVKGDMPDIIAFKAGESIAFECKAWEQGLAITKSQFDDLLRFNAKGGVRTMIAWKRNHKGWRLFGLNQFSLSPKGFMRLTKKQWETGSLALRD